MTAAAPGAYYSAPGVDLFLGDCRVVLPALGVAADLILTDPPYEQTPLGWDRWPAGWLGAAAAAAASMWCFLPLRQFAAAPYRGREFAAAGWKLSQDLVWEKHNGSSFAADRFKRVHENLAHWYRGPWGALHHDTPTIPGAPRPTATITARHGKTPHTGDIGTGDPYVYGPTRLARTVLQVRSMHGRAIHPTEKPVELLDPLIRYACPPGGLVVDPFAGSGSTGAAALAAGRRVLLVEADERHCEQAAQRLQALVRAEAGAAHPHG